MSLTESDMNALREMLVDECGKAAKGTEDRLGARFAALESSVNGKIDSLSSRVDGLSSRVDGLSSRVDGLSSTVDALSRKVDGLAADMVEVKAGLRTVVARLDLNEDDVRNTRLRLALLAQAKG